MNNDTLGPFNIKDLEDYSFYGYSFIREDDKTIITYRYNGNDYLLSIVDNNTPLRDVERILNNGVISNFTYDGTNKEQLESFVSNIESSTGKQIDYIVFGTDGYNIVVDGESNDVPYTERGSVDSTNAIDAITKEGSLNGSDYITDENIDSLVTYLDQEFGDQYDVKYIKTNNGKIKILVNNQELIECDESYRISDVLSSIDNIIRDDANKPIDLSNKSGRGRTSKIFINLSNAYEIKELYSKSLENLSSFYNLIDISYITNKLKEYYENLNDNSPELLYALSNFIGGIIETINSCIQLYLSKDEKDFHELESLCDELWGSLDEMHVTYKQAANMTRSQEMYSSLMTTGELSSITGEEYIGIMEESDAFFDGLYAESIEEFQTKLTLAYQSFLRNSMPQIYNTLLEGICANLDYDVESTKESIASQILSCGEYTPEWIEENIPSDVWSSATTDYERALLLVSYDEKAISYDYLNMDSQSYYESECLDNNFILSLMNNDPTHSREIVSFCFPTIQAANVIKTFCTTDYSQMEIDEAINKSSEILKHLSMLTDSQSQSSAYISSSSILSCIPYIEPIGILRDNDYFKRCNVAKWRHWSRKIQEDKAMQSAYIRYYNQKYGTSYVDFDEYIAKEGWMPASIVEKNLIEIDGSGSLEYPINIDGSGECDLNDPNFSINRDDILNYQLYTITFDDDFLKWYAMDSGFPALKSLTDSYCLGMGRSEHDIEGYLDNIIYNEYTVNSITADSMYSYVSPFATILQDFCQEKIVIDSTKSNFGMASAEALLTDDVTEEQMKTAEEYYYSIVEELNDSYISPFDVSEKEKTNGWDYLEDWQKKALAKIYFLSPDSAKDLIFHGYHNSVIQKIGYEKAETTAAGMTGKYIDDDTARDIYRAVLGVPITATKGAWDGMMTSVENVVNLASADGIMNQNDYYRLRLAELLQEDQLMSTVYNVSNGVGNMIIPLALSSFVPYIGGELSLLWSGASTAGSELESMLKQGYDRGTSYKVAVSKGIVAMFSEKMLGGITGIGKEADKPLKIFNKLVGSNSKMAQFLGTTLSNQFREVGQELFENGVGYGIDAIFTHEIASVDQIVQESWQTAYQTFLSTPLINFVGSSFQKMAPNVPHVVKLDDGTKITYTNAEMQQFIDANGNLDQNAFFGFLIEHDRVDTSVMIARAQMDMDLYLSAPTANFKEDEVANKNISIVYSHATTKSVFDVNTIILTLMELNGCSQKDAIEIIETAVFNKNYNMIGLDGDLQSMISQYSYDELDDTLLTIRSIDSINDSVMNDAERIVEALMERYNIQRDEAIKKLQTAVRNEKMENITRYGDARFLFSQHSFVEWDTAVSKMMIGDYIDFQQDNAVNYIDDSNNNTNEGYVTPHDYFMSLSKRYNSTYGVDQGGIYRLISYMDDRGNLYNYKAARNIINDAKLNNKPIPHFKEVFDSEYNKVKNYMVKKYGISQNETSILLSSIDDKGACTYASAANEIFYSYRGHEHIFEEKFGFSMYDKETGRPNYELLLADMYLNINRKENGGQLFVTDSNGNVHLNQDSLSGKVDPLGRPLLDAEKQVYLSYRQIGRNKDIINNYLQSKGASYKSHVLSGSDNQVIVNYENTEFIRERLNQGYVYTIDLYSTYKAEDGQNYRSYPIRMMSQDSNYSSLSTDNWNGGSHSNYITGVNEEGFLVSSWGRKYLIPFKDLSEFFSKWVLTESKIDI